jgi:transposase
MAKTSPARPKRRQYTDEFRRAAVQMLLDGLSAKSVAERLGFTDPTILYL